MYLTAGAKMRKAKAFFLIFFMVSAVFFSPLFAQEEYDPDYEEIPIDSDWGDYIPSLYSRGDKTFAITMGVVFPTLFFEMGTLKDSHLFPVGGTGSLAFSYFFNSHFFLGGEIGGLFNYTLAENTLFIIPMGPRLGYQFIIGKFEIPLTLVLGIAPHRFLDQGLLGFFIKGGGSFFFRFSPDWSFGLNANWLWFPEWTREPSKNADGNFIDLTLSARYHF
jgi:hypothetical protein